MSKGRFVEMAIAQEIGETAGCIWKLLESDGAHTLPQIKKKLSTHGGRLDYALGWLAREDKIEFVPEKKTFRVMLK